MADSPGQAALRSVFPVLAGSVSRAAAVAEPAEKQVPLLRIGVWIFLSTVCMLFAAFTSSYLVRSGGLGWRDFPLPSMLWPNTAVLLLSSVALEWARRSERIGQPAAARNWAGAAGGLAILFLGGQVFAWQSLQADGIYLSGNPRSSFFYLLTGVHAVHLVGGLAVLGYMELRLAAAARLGRYEQGRLREPLAACGIYWHFVTATWLYVWALLLAA